MALDPKSRETRQRLERCWALDFEWDLFPISVKEVQFNIIVLPRCRSFSLINGSMFLGSTLTFEEVSSYS